MIRSFSSGRTFLGVALLTAVCLAGCAPTSPTSDYGAIDGATSRTSPDSFSIMRHLCVERGLAVTSLVNLPANGERKLSTLIWAPQDFRSHEKDAMDWVDRWLKSGGKTFVYVAADYSPMADYWKLTSEMHTTERDRRNAAINAALEQAKLLNRLASGYQNIAYPWGVYRKRLGELGTAQPRSGNWSAEINNLDSNLKLRSYFQTWDEVSDAEIEQLIKSQGKNNTSSSTQATGSSSSPTQPSQPSSPSVPWQIGGDWGEEYVLAEKARRESVETAEISDDNEMQSHEDLWVTFGGDAAATMQEEASNQLTEDVAPDHVTAKVLMSGKDNTPFLSVVTKPSWNGSRIILVANASLFSNLSMTYEGNRAIAERLVDGFSQGRVGFLSQASEPSVLDGENSSTGLAALLTKPVNLLAAHLVFLGLVALLYLWPIFGRPLELPVPSTQSFSLHINALGSLLQKTGDQFYARTTIADYFRQVKRDPNSIWSKVDAEYTSSQASPFRQDEVNSASKNTNG